MEELFSREQIAARVAELGSTIGRFYEGKPLSLIILTNGAIFFGADLARAIPQSVLVDTLGVESYFNDKRGELKIYAPCKMEHRGRHVLLADDVLDSGNTLKQCTAYFEQRGALSVHNAVLIRKQVSQRVFEADWFGFEAPDRYLVGMGMDLQEEYRNHPGIGVM